jgi:hypothetical protein
MLLRVPAPQDPSIEAAGGDGTPFPKTVPAMGTTTTAGEATADDPAASTGLATSAPSSPPQMASAIALVGTDDNANEEPEVIMGHLSLRAPGDVSLFEVMGATHFALNQVHDMLRREREDINKEWLCLLVWVSMLKKQTTSEKEKAEVRQKCLDVIEILLDKRQVATNQLNAMAQELLAGAKELFS